MITSLSRSKSGVSESESNDLIWQAIWKAGLGANVTEAKSPDSLESVVRDWEERLNGIGDDAQLANVDQQNMRQKQQQILQMLSTISKTLHDTALGVIRKIEG